MNAAEMNAGPWYRQIWPWLLMAPPLASVIGGLTMVYLAAHEPTALVVDDYARIEDITRERFERDVRAGALALAAEVDFGARSASTTTVLSTAATDRSAAATSSSAAAAVRSAATTVEVALSGSEAFDPPASLKLSLRHAGSAGLDRNVILEQRSAVRYTGTIELADGRYDVELAPADSSWRLAGSLSRVPATLRLTAQARSGG